MADFVGPPPPPEGDFGLPGGTSTIMKCAMCKSLEDSISNDLLNLNLNSNTILNQMTDLQQQADSVTSWSPTSEVEQIMSDYETQINDMIPDFMSESGTDATLDAYTLEFKSTLLDNEIYQDPSKLMQLGINSLANEYLPDTPAFDMPKLGLSGFEETVNGFDSIPQSYMCSSIDSVMSCLGDMLSNMGSGTPQLSLITAINDLLNMIPDIQSLIKRLIPAINAHLNMGCNQSNNFAYSAQLESNINSLPLDDDFNLTSDSVVDSLEGLSEDVAASITNGSNSLESANSNVSGLVCNGS